MKNKRKIISDELLAAFLDGNSTPEEAKLALEAISCNESIAEVMEISSKYLSSAEIHNTAIGDLVEELNIFLI
jgi:hypothetical protein